MTSAGRKVDHKKLIASYTAAAGRFETVEVPIMQFLMIDGHGDPNTQAYVDAVSSLYPLAYGLKFLSRSESGQDYVVMPLEALWWAEDMEAFTGRRDKSLWFWTAMIMVPDRITVEHLEEVRSRKDAPRIDDVRLDRLDEGMCVQTLHLGSYDDEAPVLAAMHEAIAADGLQLTGRHHEIYLSDPRRTAPDKLRTILRQPVTR